MSLAFACLWVVAANVIAMLPSKDYHWRAAYGLMAIGLPLGLWLGTTAGPWAAAAFALAAASILRWPLRYALRRLTAGRIG